MINTYMKTVLAACVATFTFLGLQNPTLAANIETSILNSDVSSEHFNIKLDEKKHGLNQPNVEKTIGDMLQIPYDPELYAKQPEKPIIDFSIKPTLSEPEMEPQEEEQEEPAVSISNKETDLLARLVEAEAKGESYDGKVAVATVVLNRVESTQFPDSVKEVIYEVVGESYAFSPVQNGEINKPASDEAKRAVEEALHRKDRLNESIYFYNPEIATDDWIRTREVVKTIGNHVFAK